MNTIDKAPGAAPDEARDAQSEIPDAFSKIADQGPQNRRGAFRRFWRWVRQADALEALADGQVKLWTAILQVGGKVEEGRDVHRWELEALVMEIANLRGVKAQAIVARRVTEYVRARIRKHNATVEAAQQEHTNG